jgi:hypothetical protein
MRFETVLDFERILGKEIEIKGKISKVVWQHMIVQQLEYPEISYFSLLDEQGEEYHQFVVYSKKKIPESGIYTLQGRIIKSEGENKHLDQEKRKYYYEFQFIAENFTKENSL